MTSLASGIYVFDSILIYCEIWPCSTFWSEHRTKALKVFPLIGEGSRYLSHNQIEPENITKRGHSPAIVRARSGNGLGGGFPGEGEISARKGESRGHIFYMF